jgi:hypothetical protein
MYLHPNSYSIIFLAVVAVIGASFGFLFLAISASLKSILLPTNIFGTFETFY